MALVHVANADVEPSQHAIAVDHPKSNDRDSHSQLVDRYGSPIDLNGWPVDTCVWP